VRTTQEVDVTTTGPPEAVRGPGEPLPRGSGETAIPDPRRELVRPPVPSGAQPPLDAESSLGAEPSLPTGAHSALPPSSELPLGCEPPLGVEPSKAGAEPCLLSGSEASLGAGPPLAAGAEPGLSTGSEAWLGAGPVLPPRPEAPLSVDGQGAQPVGIESALAPSAESVLPSGAEAGPCDLVDPALSVRPSAGTEPTSPDRVDPGLSPARPDAVPSVPVAGEPDVADCVDAGLPPGSGPGLPLATGPGLAALADPGVPERAASALPPVPAAPVPAAAPPAALAAAPPRRWGLGAYLLAEAVFLLSSVLLVLPYLGEGTSPPPPVLVLGLIAPSLLAATVALLATWLRGNGPLIDLGLRFDRTDLVRGLTFGLGGLVLSIPAAALWSRVVGENQANSAVGEVFAGQRFDLPLAIAVFLVVWLLAPICEEILYRGLLWGAVERHAGRWWAFGVTTLSFALVHFEFLRTPLLLVISIPIGLARLCTGRLSASIVAHQINNLLPAAALMFMLMGVLQT
jgi:membrane protease YdiL (CAAX protease family)